MERVSVIWSATAEAGLAKLPLEARQSLLDGIAALRDADDFGAVCDPLLPPLCEKFNFICGRYKAIYTVQRDQLASGDVLTRVEVVAVTAKDRTEDEKRQIYRLAQKLMNIIEEDESEQE